MQSQKVTELHVESRTRSFLPYGISERTLFSPEDKADHKSPVICNHLALKRFVTFVQLQQASQLCSSALDHHL